MFIHHAKQSGKHTLAKIGHLSALGQEQKRVKGLEQNSRRLVNGALPLLDVVRGRGYTQDAAYQNGLPAIDKAPKEADDVVSRLAVETRRRLIQEQQRRLRHKLDTESHPLSLLNAQTSTGICCFVSEIRLHAFVYRKENLLPMRASQKSRSSRRSMMCST